MALEKEKINKIYEEERIRAEARREYSEELDEEEYEEPKKTSSVTWTIFILILFFWCFGSLIFKSNSSPEDQAQKAEQEKAEADATVLKARADAVTAKAEAEEWEKNPAKPICDAHPTWKKDECELVYKGKIWVGMSYDMLVYEAGKPDTKNVSNYGNGSEYQYCWDDLTPNCFYDDDNDGLIDAYN